MNLVTVGIPVYNGEKTLPRALDSLLKQDFDLFDIIISDNNSTDSTNIICENYSSISNKIKYSKNDKNIGLNGNVFKLLSLSKSPYFFLASDDDYWSPKFISTLVNDLESHPDAAVSMCAINRVDTNSNLVDIYRFSGTDNPNKKNYFSTATVVSWQPKWFNVFICGLFRLEVLKRARFLFPAHLSHERFILCTIALAHRFRYIDKPLFYKTIYHRDQKREWREIDPYFSTRFSQRSFFTWTAVLAKAIWQFEDIPLHRKLYIVGPIFRRLSWELKRKAGPQVKRFTSK